jgi:hypothetical protein
MNNLLVRSAQISIGRNPLAPEEVLVSTKYSLPNDRSRNPAETTPVESMTIERLGAEVLNAMQAIMPVHYCSSFRNYIQDAEELLGPS